MSRVVGRKVYFFDAKLTGWIEKNGGDAFFNRSLQKWAGKTGVKKHDMS